MEEWTDEEYREALENISKWIIETENEIIGYIRDEDGYPEEVGRVKK